MKNEKKLSQYLLKNHLIQVADLRRCLEIRKKSNKRSLQEILIEKELFTQLQLTQIQNSMLVGKRVNISGIELESKLAEGGMGSVYKGMQITLRRPVAIKIMSSELSKDKNFIARFAQEARVLAKLNHPSIVRAIDFGESDGLYYYVMEYVEGQNLEELVHEKGSMDEEQAIDIISNMAKALEHAHTIGLIHRDIKPANIILCKDGKTKLCDLGLAKWIRSNASLTCAGAIVGTPHYISPEQIKGVQELDIRTDIYCLGATLFFMLTGEPPYSGQHQESIYYQHMHEPIPNIQEKCPEISQSTTKLFSKMMAKKPEERFQNPTELLDFLENYLYQQKKKKITTRMTKSLENSPEIKGIQTQQNSIKTPTQSMKKMMHRTTKALPIQKKQGVESLQKTPIKKEESHQTRQLKCPDCKHIFFVPNRQIKCPSCSIDYYLLDIHSLLVQKISSENKSYLRLQCKSCGQNFRILEPKTKCPSCQQVFVPSSDSKKSLNVKFLFAALVGFACFVLLLLYSFGCLS